MAYTYVDRDAQLRGLAQRWKQEPALAIDLEMEANLHHYGVHLALIQLATEQETWLIDPLAIQDPEPLKTLFEDENVEKVFHDVSFDFRILEEAWDCRPKNTFDTKTAAILLGKDTISLAGLLNEYYGIKKDEKYQRVDWLRRPLTKDMLAYAAGDVAYLLKLKRRLEQELKEKGRITWAQEEFRHAERQRHALPPKDHQDLKGAKSLNDHERGRLKALYEARERLAEQTDRPPFYIIPTNLLLELAKHPPKTEEAWRSLKRVHPLVKRQAHKLAKAMRDAKPDPSRKSTGPPKRRRLTPQQGRQVQALLDKRDRVAERLGIERASILTREQAEHHVLGSPNSTRRWQRALLDLEDRNH